MSQSLIRYFDFKIFQVNMISSLSQFGMYLCLPVLGYLSDVYGTNLLAFLSIILLAPSYFINYLIVEENSFKQQTQLVLFCITFCLIGLGTSSLYFLSLLTCSKIFPKRKGISISLPVACYGLSSLISSQILNLSYFTTSRGLDLGKVFKYFSILYLIMGSTQFVATSIEVDHKQLNIDETTELIPISSIEPPNHQEKFIKFLKSSIMWILLASFFVNLGPLETFQNNLNSILKHFHKSAALNQQIGVLSIFSTCSRLFVGFLSDYINKLWILLVILLVGTWCQYLSISYSYITLITVLDGFTYGGVFTIYPTIISDIWGVDILGSTWGMFMIAPALSSTLFSLMYGNFLDTTNDLTKYFELSTLSFIISLLLVLYIIISKRAFRLHSRNITP